MAEPTADRPLRRVRRPLRARDAGAGVPGAGGRVPRGVGRPGVPRRAATRSCATTPVVRRSSPSATTSATSSASACCSSARTSTTPARTRSTTCSARPCWPSGWARRASSPRPVPASTAWPAATAAALMGLECKVYMGAVDVERQELNVFRMRLLGAEVEAVHSGSRTLKDAVNEAMRDWVATVGDTALLPRLGDGPAPVPVDGARVPPGHRRRGPRAVPRADRRRARRRRRLRRRRLQRDRHLLAASSTPTPAWSASSRPAARRSAAACPGVVHGMRSYLMQDEYGQVRGGRSRSRPASTTRASAPSTRTSRPSGGPSTRPSPTPR